MNIPELVEALTKAQAALDAQAQSQPEIDRLNATLNQKYDYIARLETDILELKSDIETRGLTISRLETETDILRRERDDHGLEALALRDELDTLKANIDRALNAATETFYTTMQMKQEAKSVDHVHKPISDQSPPKPPEAETFTEIEPNQDEQFADWNEWNIRRIDFNNRIPASGPNQRWDIVKSNFTHRDFIY